MDWQGRDRLTYADLAGRAGRLARRLRELGVGPDVAVAVCLRRSPAMAVAVLAALEAGGPYVPVDPSYPRERLEMMMAIARPRVLLTETGLRDALPAGDFDVICLDVDDLDAGAELAAAREGRVSPDNLAYVIFTSGSTGVPKGVAMPHRPLVNLVAWQLRNSTLGPGARTLQFASLSFDVSCQELFSTWAAGGTLVLISEELRLDAFALLAALRKAAVERLFAPFVALQQLAEVAAERDAWPESLREIVTAGEQLQITSAVAGLFARLPGCRLFNQYGPSETHVATAYALTGPARSWPALPSIGGPVANTRILVLDPELGPAPIGVPGELYIGGDCLARGYLSRPDLTAERFVPDPFADGERLYRTGDLARWSPEGNVEFLGRTDQQLKIRGFRVEPGEIESVLAAHPRVREAAVVARQDPGSPARRLVAYVVALGEDVAAAELRSRVRERLPEYMVPSAFHFLEALPLTPSGKVDRRALPDLEAVGEQSIAVTPRTPFEELIAGIWRGVLGIERIEAGETFFDAGRPLAPGHPARLPPAKDLRDRAAAPARLRGADVHRPGPECGAGSARGAARATADPPSLTAGEGPPLFRAAAALADRPARAGQSCVQHPPGSPPDAARWCPGCWSGSSARSSAGTRRCAPPSRPAKSKPVQVIAAPAPARAAAPRPVRTCEDQREARGRARALGRGGPTPVRPRSTDRCCACVLVRLAETDHLLLLTLHHIVSDGWSMGVLLREVAALYEAFRGAGRRRSPSCRCSTPISPSGSASWLQGEVLAAQLNFWKRQLAGAPRAGAAPRPPAPGGADLPRRHAAAPSPAWPLGGCAGAVPARRSDTLSWPCSPPRRSCWHATPDRKTSLVGSPVAGRNRRGDRRPDRLLRQHPGAAHATCRTTRASASCWPGAPDGSRRLHAPGRSLRAARRGACGGAGPGASLRSSRCSSRCRTPRRRNLSVPGLALAPSRAWTQA